MDEYKRCTVAAELRMGASDEQKEPTDLTEALLVAARKNEIPGREKSIK